MAAFYIRTTKKQGTAHLITEIQRPKFGLKLKITTPIEVDIEDWNHAHPKKGSFDGSKDPAKLAAHLRSLETRYFNSQPGRKVKEQMDKVTSTIAMCMKSGIHDTEGICKAIDAVLNEEMRDAIAQKEKADAEARQRKEEAERANPLIYTEAFAKGVASGSIRNKNGEKYSYTSIEGFNLFAQLLGEFYKANPFTWESINRLTVDAFRSFIESKGYMTASVNRFVSLLNTVINRALEDGVHNNSAAHRYFHLARITDENSKVEVYLTADEIQAYYEMELKGKEAMARDIFLCGVYTCQRFGDYSTLSPSNFTTTARGTKVVRLTQDKTKTTVIIPILSNNLLTIAARYDYKVPKMTNEVLTRNVRKSLAKLSKNVPSLAEEYKTVLTVREVRDEENKKRTFKRDESGYILKPKYELVGTHTARRSGITNLYLTHKFDMVQLMSISGHKAPKVFRHYIKLSSEEIANEIDEIAKQLDNNLF